MMDHLQKTPSFEMGGGRGIGPAVQGPALVSSHGFGVRYDLHPETGVISNQNHDLYGHSVAGRILVFTRPKGGVAASWSLADLQTRGLAPLGIIFRRASPIFAQGALFAGLTLLHDLDGDPCTRLQTGDVVSLLPAEGRLEVFRNAAV